MHSQETGGGSGGGCCGGIFYLVSGATLDIQKSAIEQRWPKHSFPSTPEGAGWTTRTACLKGCLARTSYVYRPAPILRPGRESNLLWRWSYPEQLHRVCSTSMSAFVTSKVFFFDNVSFQVTVVVVWTQPAFFIKKKRKGSLLFFR